MRNRKLFYKVAEAIEAEPHRYDQQSWCSVPNRNWDGLYSGWQSFAPKNSEEVKTVINCGTAFCVAGWATMIAIQDGSFDYRDKDLVWEETGREVLGIDREESEWLFSEWWRPDNDMTVPEALRAYGDGEDILPGVY